MGDLLGVGIQVNPKLRKALEGGTLTRFAQDAVTEVMEAGEQRLDEHFRPRDGGPRGVFLTIAQAAKGKASTGNYRRNVNGIARGLRARIDDGRVIYGPWLENGRGGTRFRGYHVWRTVRQWLRKQTRPIARKHVRRWIRTFQ